MFKKKNKPIKTAPKKSKEPIGYMKPNFWQLKVEKLLHTEDLSLKKESRKNKKK